MPATHDEGSVVQDAAFDGGDRVCIEKGGLCNYAGLCKGHNKTAL